MNSAPLIFTVCSRRINNTKFHGSNTLNTEGCSFLQLQMMEVSFLEEITS